MAGSFALWRRGCGFAQSTINPLLRVRRVQRSRQISEDNHCWRRTRVLFLEQSLARERVPEAEHHLFGHFSSRELSHPAVQHRWSKKWMSNSQQVGLAQRDLAHQAHALQSKTRCIAEAD